MQEALRRQYLALMGVDVWLPRDAADEMVAAVPEALPAMAGTAVAAPRAPLPDDLPRRLDALREAPAATAIPALDAPVAKAPAVITPAVPAAAAGVADRFGCSLLALPDGLLLVAAYVMPDAPGLAGPEYALLASIAAALAPGTILPAAEEFRWPPPGASKLPAMSRPGAGVEALTGLLAERRRRGLRDVLVLGEAMTAPVSAAATRLGLQVVPAPSLAAMLADPAQKRACWDAARPLRRGAP